ncbi:MAG: low temperature requirement protein A [Longimicrobiales bacterium]
MGSRSVVSPADQRVTFVELFFDLVFVFSVTQVVGLLHDGITWAAVGQVVLVFWLVWWGWTQFTWALNAADTTHHLVEIGVLAATVVAFFMAVGVPGAFHGRAIWFAVPYVAGRVIGLALYGWVAAVADPSQHAAVRQFTIISSSGLVAVLGGALVGGVAQYWLWGLTILLDVVAAIIAGRSASWNLHPEHFAERHGLFVIIALGETLIVAAAAINGDEWTASRAAVATLAVAVSCGMWWTYFTRAKPVLDLALESRRGAARSILARSVFSLAHFPMLCGVIAYAVAIEHAIAYPAEAFQLEARLALAGALLLFVGGMAVALVLAHQRIPTPRLVLTGLTAAAIVALQDLPSIWLLLVALSGVVAVAALEQRAT